MPKTIMVVDDSRTVRQQVAVVLGERATKCSRLSTGSTPVERSRAATAWR